MSTSVTSRYSMLNRMPHALLIEGAADQAQDVQAKELAQYLLCQQKNQQFAHSLMDAQACGQCRSCQLFMHHTHPDYHVLTPAESYKAIKIDEVRQLIIQLTQAPHIASCHVVFIAYAEQMNIASANALLKILEEPIGETYFLLLTQQARRLLPTIRSRCQLIKCQHTLDETNDIEALFNKIDGWMQNPATINLTALIEWGLKKWELKQLLDHLSEYVSKKIKHQLISYKQADTLQHEKILLRYYQILDEIYLQKKYLNQQLSLNANLLLEKIFIMLSDFYFK